MLKIDQYPDHLAAERDHQPAPTFDQNGDADDCAICDLAVVLHPYTGRWVHGLPE